MPEEEKLQPRELFFRPHRHQPHILDGGSVATLVEVAEVVPVLYALSVSPVVVNHTGEAF